MAKDYDQQLYDELTKEDFNYSKVKKLIKKGGNLNFSIDKEGRTVLMQAIEDRSTDMIELYLKKGKNVNVNAVDNNGNTALMHEINTDYSDIKIEYVRLLIDSGADVNHKNNFGMTPLEYAVRTDRKNSLETIKILLENGADISKCKYNLLQLLHNEAENYEEIRALLIEIGVKAEPFFIQYKLKAKCMECGKFIPINYPAQKIQCDYCQSDIDLNEDLWKTIFEYDSGLITSLNYEIDIDKRKTKPICTNHKCKEEIDIEDISIGNNKGILCQKCGKETQNYPAPEWFKNYTEHDTRPAQIIGADQPSKQEFKTVITKCISCGASLSVSPENPRITNCEHCDTSQYLPDEIWLKLHPVKSRKTWYILFS